MSLPSSLPSPYTTHLNLEVALLVTTVVCDSQLFLQLYHVAEALKVDMHRAQVLVHVRGLLEGVFFLNQGGERRGEERTAAKGRHLAQMNCRCA